RARLREQGLALLFAPSPLPANDAQGETPFASLAQFHREQPDIRLLLCAESAGRREALLPLLQRQGLQPELLDGWQAFADGTQTLALTVGSMDQGFYSPAQ